MRTFILSGWLSVASAAIVLTACSKPNGESAASGEVTSAAAMRLEIGGQPVSVGDHKVEARVFADGRAEALVLDARGKAIAEPTSAKLTMNANAKGGQKAAIDLAWDPALARFAGKAAGKVDLEASPIDVELKIGDASAKGKLDAPVLLVGPEMGGTLFVAGKYGIEVAPRIDGSVEAIVRHADGAKVDGNAKLKLEANGVVLVWDPPSARFLGKAESAAKLSGGPVEVSIDGAVAAKLPRIAVRAEAAHGGRVVVAGDYSVELVAKGDLVNAFVFDASGAAVARADLDLSMRLANGAFVKLVWDAPSASYRADVDGKIDFATAPIAVALKADGKAHAGASLPTVEANASAKGIANAKVDIDPKIDAKANANANANANAKAKADVNVDPKAKVDAKAKVNAPKVDVKPVSVNKNASASAGTGGGANAGAKAGFSLGTK